MASAASCAIEALVVDAEILQKLHIKTKHTLRDWPGPCAHNASAALKKTCRILDNQGGGYCGFYALSITNYVLSGGTEVLSVEDLQAGFIAEAMRRQQDTTLKADERKKLARYLELVPHEVEDFELGWFMQDKGVNMAILGRQLDQWSLQPVLYHANYEVWIIFCGTGGHWMNAVKQDADGSLCLGFTLKEYRILETELSHFEPLIITRCGALDVAGAIPLPGHKQKNNPPPPKKTKAAAAAAPLSPKTQALLMALINSPDWDL